MHVTKTLLLTLSIGSLLAAGCGKSNTDTTPPEPAVTAPPADTPPVTEPMPEPTPEPAAETPPPPPAPPPLTDAEITAVTKAANDAEIEQGKLAKTMAKDKQVKAFAAMMVKDHTDANKRQEKLAKKATIEPKESELSKRLTDDNKAKTETLKGTAKGADFDKAYIAAQVEAHTTVLNAIDTQLLPGAQNPDLKAELEALRPKVEGHLNQAKEIQTALAAGPATAAS